MKKSALKTSRLSEALSTLHEAIVAAVAWLKQRTATDAQVVLLVLFVSLLLRVPFVAHPPVTLFDEAIYTNFTIYTADGRPFFDIHPPLARMIFAAVADNTRFSLLELPWKAGESYLDFPHEALRTMMAFLGSLLPLLLYAIGRLLGYTPRMALLPAFFVAIDNALVLYSRTILPDTLLLLAGMLGFAAALAAIKSPERTTRILLVLVSGLALGLAASIKWTALGVFAVVWLVFAFERKWKYVFATAFLGIFVYLFVFASYFLWFPEGGKLHRTFSTYDAPWIQALEFPRGTDTKEILSYLPRYHETMLRANRDEVIKATTLQAPGPIAWPMSRTSITFWVGDDGKHIRLIGNELLWFMSFLALLFELGWILWHLLFKKRWEPDRVENLLLAGYAINYLPFFFIDRPMYLYHYFVALLFLFMLVPRVALRMVHCLETITKDRLLAQTLAGFVLLLIVVNFFLLAPATYGI